MSKTQQFINLMAKAGFVTLKEAMDITGWHHTVAAASAFSEAKVRLIPVDMSSKAKNPRMLYLKADLAKVRPPRTAASANTVVKGADAATVAKVLALTERIDALERRMVLVEKSTAKVPANGTVGEVKAAVKRDPIVTVNRV